jgi:hypothetical protein
MQVAVELSVRDPLSVLVDDADHYVVAMQVKACD